MKARLFGLLLIGGPLAACVTSCGGQDEAPYAVAFHADPDAGLCGDGVREKPEVCDGTDFGAATCASATMDQAPKGSLRCSSLCAIDVSDCKSASAGGSGAGGSGAGGSNGAGGGNGAGGEGAGGLNAAGGADGRPR
jgi:hypothetical protein